MALGPFCVTCRSWAKQKKLHEDLFLGWGENKLEHVHSGLLHQVLNHFLLEALWSCNSNNSSWGSPTTDRKTGTPKSPNGAIFRIKWYRTAANMTFLQKWCAKFGAFFSINHLCFPLFPATVDQWEPIENMHFLWPVSWNCPLQALCCALCSTEQSTFRKEEKRQVPRRGEEEGSPGKWAKGNKGGVKTNQTIYHTTNDFRSPRGIFRGVVHELSERKRRTKSTSPPSSHWRCPSWLFGGGAWIVGFETPLLGQPTSGNVMSKILCEFEP